MLNPVVRSLLLLAVLWLTACSNLALSARAGAPTPVEVTITGQASGAPEGCSAQEVGQVLVDFANALQASDPEAVLTFFSNPAQFAWYSAPDGDPAAPTALYSTNDLPQYFERRRAKHEVLQFKEINVNGWDSHRGLVHFDFVVNRQADDLNNGTGLDVIGKGAIHCRSQSFAVISLGDG